MELVLSLLDYAPIDMGQSASESMMQSIEIAKMAEGAGFEKVWYSEHHGASSLASVAPELMIASAGAHTKSIRLGSGAILLPNHGSFKVAENFLTLEAMYPGRIDLGVGRASGATAEVIRAVNNLNFAGIEYLDKLDELLNYIGDNKNEIDEKFLPTPKINTKVKPWILGSSGHTALLAAKKGIGFSFAHFINTTSTGPQAAEIYRKNFVPSVFFKEPQVNVAVYIALGKTANEAELLAKSFHIWLNNIETGNEMKLLPLNEVEKHEFSTFETMNARKNAPRLVHGTLETVWEQLEKIAILYGSNQIMVNPFISGQEYRLQTVELLGKRNKEEAKKRY